MRQGAAGRQDTCGAAVHFTSLLLAGLGQGPAAAPHILLYTSARCICVHRSFLLPLPAALKTRWAASSCLQSLRSCASSIACRLRWVGLLFTNCVVGTAAESILLGQGAPGAVLHQPPATGGGLS